MGTGYGQLRKRAMPIMESWDYGHLVSFHKIFVEISLAIPLFL